MVDTPENAATTAPARHVARTGGVALGIDIGGSGIKGAPVDLKRGELEAERFRLDTPQPAKPHEVAEVVREVAKHFDWSGPVGVTFPGVISQGVIRTAANMDHDWVGLNGADVFSAAIDPTPESLLVVNDADAAGLAEVTHGAALGQTGVVLMLTFGTGIGSALFVDGHLVPNTELGHLQMRGKDAELRASAKVREEKQLDWAKWSKRVQEYLDMVDALFSPDLVVIGGGVSRHGDKFIPLLKMHANIVAAHMANDAGIIGAALAASGAIPSAVATTPAPAAASTKAEPEAEADPETKTPKGKKAAKK